MGIDKCCFRHEKHHNTMIDWKEFQGLKLREKRGSARVSRQALQKRSALWARCNGQHPIKPHSVGSGRQAGIQAGR